MPDDCLLLDNGRAADVLPIICQSIHNDIISIPSIRHKIIFLSIIINCQETGLDQELDFGGTFIVFFM